MNIKQIAAPLVLTGFALLNMGLPAYADREGVPQPHRRVGGGTRVIEMVKTDSNIEKSKQTAPKPKKPPVKRNPGGRVPGGARFLEKQQNVETVSWFKCRFRPNACRKNTTSVVATGSSQEFKVATPNRGCTCGYDANGNWSCSGCDSIAFG